MNASRREGEADREWHNVFSQSKPIVPPVCGARTNLCLTAADLCSVDSIESTRGAPIAGLLPHDVNFDS